MSAGKPTSLRSCYGSAHLKSNGLQVIEASERDNLKDEDGDNIADVDQMTSAELIEHKVSVALAAVDPVKLNNAVQQIYTAAIAVVGVLKLEFARTVALGNAIGDVLMVPVNKFVAPLAMKCFPEEYAQWCPVLLNYAVKSIAISIAWTLQRMISAVHSAIRGGLMCSRGLLNYLQSKDIISFNDKESTLDEIVGWSMALLGFYVQMKLGFELPFPINIICLPFSMAESYLVWSIMSD